MAASRVCHKFAAQWRNLCHLRIGPATPQLTSKGAEEDEEVEEGHYPEGGLKRVNLGDTLDNGRFIVLRRLAYGSHYTVWLAKDTKPEHWLLYPEYVAIKILRATGPGVYSSMFEIEKLELLVQKANESAHCGKNHVSQLLHEFKENIQPSGFHTCLVFKVCGGSLQEQTMSFAYGRLPVAVVKEATRQLLEGLDFLHRECGLVHTDIKPANILVELDNPTLHVHKYIMGSQPESNHRSSDQFMQLMDALVDGKKVPQRIPCREIIPTPLIADVPTFRLRIADFGLSSYSSHVHRYKLAERVQPKELVAPEVMLGAKWGSSVDIWALGLLVIGWIKGYGITAGEAGVDGDCHYSDVDDRLAQMAAILGPFPKSLLDKASKTKEYFSEDGTLKRFQIQQRSLEEYIDGPSSMLRRPNDLQKSEVPIMCDFLRGMLALDPDDRKTASELLEHPWLSSKPPDSIFGICSTDDHLPHPEIPKRFTI